MAEVLVVGAGISGLAAAHAAGRCRARRRRRRQGTSPRRAHGHPPRGRRHVGHRGAVPDRQGRGVHRGGRPLATGGRRRTWFHGSPGRDAARDDDAGDPRFRGAPYMRAIPEALAGGLAVRCGVRVDELRHVDGRWVGLTDAGAHLSADALVLTAPAPQALALLGGAQVAGEVVDGLRTITYAPCWAVLVRPDAPPDLPDHGALRLPDHPLHMISDNHRKGISTAPAVTLHAAPGRSQELLEQPGDVVGRQLLDDAAPWVTGAVVRTHRWRYALPLAAGPAATLATTTPDPLAVAGDGLVGGRVRVRGRPDGQRPIVWVRCSDRTTGRAFGRVGGSGPRYGRARPALPPLRHRRVVRICSGPRRGPRRQLHARSTSAWPPCRHASRRGGVACRCCSGPRSCSPAC